MSNKWPEELKNNPGMIGTKNQLGFMFTDISGITGNFIDYCKTNHSANVADLGCAYGVASIPVLQNTNCHLLALDLSSEHLNILKSSVSDAERKNLTCITGSFPECYVVDDNSLNAVHSSYMFHFITGDNLVIGLNKIFNSLKPGGKLFVNTSSIYFRIFKDMPAIYKSNKTKHIQWPGEVMFDTLNAKDETIPHSPNFFHLHTKEDLKNLIESIGFVTEQIFYYDIVKPAWLKSEGKGQIAGIFEKK